MAIVARKAATYRAARRNKVRAEHGLGAWPQHHGIKADRRASHAIATPRRSQLRAPEVREWTGAQLRAIRVASGVGRPPGTKAELRAAYDAVMAYLKAGA